MIKVGDKVINKHAFSEIPPVGEVLEVGQVVVKVLWHKEPVWRLPEQLEVVNDDD